MVLKYMYSVFFPIQPNMYNKEQLNMYNKENTYITLFVNFIFPSIINKDFSHKFHLL